MPEGLSPIEAGKKLHEHTSEPRQPSAARHSRTVQIGEALLLSLVTIAAAWSGYAAAKWGTESRIQLAQAATLRNLATRANLDAHSTRNFDASTFNAWFTAFTLDDPERQAIAERRFRPEFKVAFDGLGGEGLDPEQVVGELGPAVPGVEAPATDGATLGDDRPVQGPSGATTAAVTENDLFLMFRTLFSDSRIISG
jgi:hypothetical protein